MLNLCLLTDSKALVPSHIQSGNNLTVYLIAVGGNRNTRRKPTLKRGQVPTSSAHDRHWELSVLPKDTKWQLLDSNPRPPDLWASALPTELPLLQDMISHRLDENPKPLGLIKSEFQALLRSLTPFDLERGSKVKFSRT